MSARMSHDARTYGSGDMAPVSGIYVVVHNGHRRDHEVLAIRGERFPSCRTCKDEVRFHVAKVVSHITHDFDLGGPFLLPKLRAKAAKKGSG